MNTTTWVLFGPHHTPTSPARTPSAARPLATRLISAFISARLVTVPSSMTAGNSPSAAAQAATGSAAASGTQRMVIAEPGAAGVAGPAGAAALLTSFRVSRLVLDLPGSSKRPGSPYARDHVRRLDPPAVAVPHGAPSGCRAVLRRRLRRPGRVGVHPRRPEGRHRRRHPGPPAAAGPLAGPADRRRAVPVRGGPCAPLRGRPGGAQRPVRPAQRHLRAPAA